MNTLPVVDVHTHLAPDLAHRSGPGVEIADDGSLVVEGHSVGPRGLYDASLLEEWMDRTGITDAWVSVPPPLYRQGLDAAATSAWVRVINDGLVRRVASRGRLAPLAYLPLDQPAVAVAEVHRTVALGGFRGFTGAAGGQSVPLDHPELSVVWRAVAASGMPLLLHPGSSPDPRLGRHYLSNLLGNPLETTVAAAELVFGDVLSRHPELRIVLVHCGGAVAALAGRWQRGMDTQRPGVQTLRLSPKKAVRRFWVDALAHDPALLDLAIAVIGDDRVVLGSDWPFPMGLEDPVSTVQHLAPDVRDRILSLNVEALSGAPS